MVRRAIPSTEPVVNPATGETIATIPPWLVPKRSGPSKPPQTRSRRRLRSSSGARWLNQLAELISQHRDELGRIITHEHGKPWKEAKGRSRLCGQLLPVLCRLRGSSPTEAAFRSTARSRLDGLLSSGGCCGTHHALEFSARHAGQEIFRRIGGGLLLCHQTVIEDSAHDDRVVFACWNNLSYRQAKPTSCSVRQARSVTYCANIRRSA